ncbi:MAG: geranylgeranyl pyrophosphate synthase [Haloquadratum sp. J07HQX50]|nr:MAG: geranylgeranyl pyrophosphate synthase [Haloquadratum sp. J07HQX50]
MDYLERRVSMVEDRLESVISTIEPSTLADEISHVALAGGKRVRPAVTILSCEACGGEPSAAVDFAVAVECVHNASLVVDDIIDRSEVRRGSRSAWANFGYGPALITSDGLLGEAFALLSQSERATEIVAQSMVELGEGEAVELVAQPTTESEYIELARRKTGALFRAAAEVGAVAADADPFTVDSFGEYAERVGIAFQIRDDVLDTTGSIAELGKPAGQDAAMNRPSLVQITELSEQEANSRAEKQAEQALNALAAADVHESQSLGYLKDLAEFVVVREQ